MALRLINGRKLVEITASRLLLSKTAPSSSAVVGGGGQRLRRGSDLADPNDPAKLRRGTLEEGEVRAWNYLWQLAPYPETEEQKVAAAKKYGMIPEDYEPYDPTDCGMGDYPKLEKSSAESRSGQLDWDYMADRRNFGEPMMVNYDLHTGTRLDDTTELPRTQLQLWMGFLAWMVGCYTAYIITAQFKRHPGVTAVQYPEATGHKEGKTHYTFDIE